MRKNKTKNGKTFIIFIVAILTLAATSCTIYHPQAVDIPLINHAGDTRIDANIAISAWALPDAVTLNLTGSYGVNDWFAVQAHFNYGGDNIYAQAAPGAYLPLGEKSVLEGYAGIGYGGAWRSVETSEDGASSGGYNYSGNYVLPFAQANIGFHDLSAAHIDIALGLKSGLYLPSFVYNDLNSNGDIASTKNYSTGSFLLEPQLLFRIGSEHVRFNIHMALCWMDNFDSSKFLYDFFTTGIGLTFHF